MELNKKRVLRKADGRIFNNIHEAVNDIRCPGPCVDGLCPLSEHVKIGDGKWTQKCNPKYYMEHPEDVLQTIGCEFLEEAEQDLYILFKDNTDVTFKADEFDGFTFDGQMLVVVKNNVIICSYNTDIVYSAELVDPDDEEVEGMVHSQYPEDEEEYVVTFDGTVNGEEHEDEEATAAEFLCDLAEMMTAKGWTVASMAVMADGLSKTGPSDE